MENLILFMQSPLSMMVIVPALLALTGVTILAIDLYYWIKSK